MAKVIEVSWYQTETFTDTFEVEDDFDLTADDADEAIEAMICEMDHDQLSTAFTGCTEREITEKAEAS